MANQVEILLKATDEASAVIKSFGDNANEALGGTNASAEKAAEGMISLGAAAGVITAAIGAAIATFWGLSEAIGQLAEKAEALENRALISGLAAEEVQKFSRMAELAGVSSERFMTSLNMLAKKAEEGSPAFKKLGIDAEQFVQLTRGEQLEVFADHIMAVSNATERVAIATQAGGRGMAEMLPVWKQVADQVDTMNVGFSTAATEGIAELEDATKRAKFAGSDLYDQMVAIIARSPELKEGILAIANQLVLMASGAKQAQPYLTDVLSILLRIVGAGQLIQGAKIINALAPESLPRVAQSWGEVSDGMISASEASKLLETGLKADLKAYTEFDKAADKAEKEREKARKWAIDQISKETEMTRKQMEAESKRLNDAADGEAKLTAKTMAEEAKQLKAIDEKYTRAAKAATDYFDHVIASVSRSSDTEVEQARRVLAECIARRAELLANVEATNEQIKRSNEAVHAAEKALDEAEKREKITNLTLLADSASSILRSLWGKHKAAAIAAAIIDTIAAIVKTMATYPWPWSLAPAAAAAAAGYAEVQKIRSQEAGFAQGTPGTSFVDFGAGTPTVLHGQEAVITQGQGETLAEMLEEAIRRANRQSGGGQPGGRPIRIDNHIHLDGREIGYDMSRRSRAGLLSLRVS